jgi:hypothetical protein
VALVGMNLETLMSIPHLKSHLERIIHSLTPKIPIIVIIVVGLVPLTWFKDEYALAYFDGEVPLPPYYGFGRVFSMWDQWSPPGGSGSLEIGNLPYISYFVLLGKLGVPLYISQAFFITTLNLIAGLSMYWLFLELFDIPKKQPGALAASLFYMNNMFLSQVIWSYFLITVFALYATLPLMMVLFVKGLRTVHQIKYGISIVLVSVLTTSAASDPPFYYPLLVIIGCYTIFYILTSPSIRLAFIRVLKFSTLITLFALLVHAWWLIPMIYGFRDAFIFTAGNRQSIGSSNLEVLWQTSAMSSFKNLFQTLGFAAFYQSFPFWGGNEKWMPYPATFMTLLFTVLSFFSPLLAFAGVITSWAKRNTLFVSGLFIGLLFMMKAAHPPFGGVFTWIMENMPILGATLRTPYNKFGMGMAFTYALLIGLGIVWLYSTSQQLFQRLADRCAGLFTMLLIGGVFVSIFGVFGYLYWTGEVIPGPTFGKGGARVEIPAYYQDADQWLQDQGNNFRVLNLPLTRLFYGTFEFDNGYFGPDPSLWLFKSPMIARAFNGSGYSMPIFLATHLSSNSYPIPTKNIACLAGLLNVRYFMLHNDTNWEYVLRLPWWVINQTDMINDPEYKYYLQNSLDYQAGIHKIITIGKLDFYENETFMPLAYAADSLTYLHGGLAEMEAALDKCDPTAPPAIFLSDVQPEFNAQAWWLSNRQTDVALPPKVELVQISPTLYTAKVHGATQSFILVFGQSFHSGWRATINGKSLPTHFMVNGYANAWFVENVGDFDIEIQFTPQRYLLVGFVVSGICIVGLIIALTIILRSKTNGTRK